MDCSSGAPCPPLSVGINLAEIPWGTPTWSQSERSMITNEFRLRCFTWFECRIQLACFTCFTHGWQSPGAPPGGQVSDISNGEHTTRHRLSMRFYRCVLRFAWCLLLIQSIFMHVHWFLFPFSMTPKHVLCYSIHVVAVYGLRMVFRDVRSIMFWVSSISQDAHCIDYRWCLIDVRWSPFIFKGFNSCSLIP